MTMIMVMLSRQPPFALIYDPVVKDHLRKVDAKHHSLIRDTIEEQLGLQPDTETRNRKPLERPLLVEATWELRFGPQNRFRVFYDVDRERREVHILAFGEKVRSRLMIGGEEVEP